MLEYLKKYPVPALESDCNNKATLEPVPAVVLITLTVLLAFPFLETSRRYPGAVVPMPTLPLPATYKSLTPLLDATFNIGEIPLPCTTNVLLGLVVPRSEERRVGKE